MVLREAEYKDEVTSLMPPCLPPLPLPHTYSHPKNSSRGRLPAHDPYHLPSKDIAAKEEEEEPSVLVDFTNDQYKSPLITKQLRDEEKKIVDDLVIEVAVIPQNTQTRRTSNEGRRSPCYQPQPKRNAR